MTLTWLTANNQLQLSGLYDYNGFANDFGVSGGYRLASIPGLELQAQAEHAIFDDSSQEDETRLVFGIKYSFNGSGHFDTLFKEKDRGALVATSLKPVAGTESITLDGRQTVVKKKVSEVDKTVLRTRLTALIEKAHSLHQADYTASSWSSLAEALANAETVLGKG